MIFRFLYRCPFFRRIIRLWRYVLFLSTFPMQYIVHSALYDYSTSKCTLSNTSHKVLCTEKNKAMLHSGLWKTEWWQIKTIALTKKNRRYLSSDILIWRLHPETDWTTDDDTYCILKYLDQNPLFSSHSTISQIQSCLRRNEVEMIDEAEELHFSNS